MGQLLMGGFTGPEPPDEFLGRIREGRLGGVILFSDNYTSPEGISSLIGRLQGAAASGPHPFPLLIALDQEGGTVRRLGEPFTPFPSASLLGTIGDSQLVRECAGATARELRSVGVNMNLAPVVDILLEPRSKLLAERSFGGSAELVARLGVAAVAGYQSEGVAATAKHFPGHGATPVDSHEALPRVDTSLDILLKRELLPYRALMDPGLPGGGTAAIMAAHIVFESVDFEKPASSSAKVLGELLRGELRFRGLAITDDLEMGAVDDPLRAAQEAVIAGADMVLVGRGKALQEGVYGAILKAAESGALRERRLEEALRRVAALKGRYAERVQGGRDFKEAVGCDAHQRLLVEVLRAAEARGRPLQT
ncbi:MAG: glycoside hydrolase family 3 protein [Nitrospinota bacterium]